MKNRTIDFKKGLTIFLFLFPALFLFVSILIAPIAVSVYRSMYDWNGFTEGTFIGFSNYIELFTNGSIKFVNSLKNSLILSCSFIFLISLIISKFKFIAIIMQHPKEIHHSYKHYVPHKNHLSIIHHVIMDSYIIQSLLKFSVFLL